MGHAPWWKAHMSGDDYDTKFATLTDDGKDVHGEANFTSRHRQSGPSPDPRRSTVGRVSAYAWRLRSGADAWAVRAGLELVGR
jgi:hypothetical protein